MAVQKHNQGSYGYSSLSTPVARRKLSGSIYIDHQIIQKRPILLYFFCTPSRSLFSPSHEWSRNISKSLSLNRTAVTKLNGNLGRWGGERCGCEGQNSLAGPLFLTRSLCYFATLSSMQKEIIINISETREFLWFEHWTESWVDRHRGLT